MSARREDEDSQEQTEELSEILDADDVDEEIAGDNGGDVAMDSDDEQEEIQLQNDSIAFFDKHSDSIFAIAQHPVYPTLVATGGSEGDADDAPGKGYIIDTSAARERPVLPASYSSGGPSSGSATTQAQNVELDALYAVDGHTDSVNCLAFTLPRGDFLVSGGLDGRLRAYAVRVPGTDGTSPASFKFVAEAQEVPEINWLAPCPSADYPNTVALGASDNSVWVYTVDPAADPANPLQLINTFWLHTAPCTAGAWTPDGALLATVAEDSSLYVWDVWGLGASKGVVQANGQAVVSMTGEDQRFEVEGGLYSLAVEPNGAFLAAGGAGGQIRVVSLPRLASSAQAGTSAKGNPGKSKTGKGAAANEVTSGGQILASLQTQSDSVETLAFVSPTGGLPNQQTTLLAAGSVDGGIAVYDATRRFAVRRNIVGAHEDFSIVKLEFVPGTWLLTSCGMDGVVRRWDLRGGGAASIGQGVGSQNAGLVKEWKGHMGDGEGGGVLGFVQGSTGERIITAGDDSVVLVFEA